MKQMKLTLIPCLAVFLLIMNTEAFSQENTLENQNAPGASEELTQAELIKLVTKAPSPQNFSNEEEYLKAKKAWIANNPEAYAIITGRPAKEKNNKVTEQGPGLNPLPQPDNSNSGKEFPENK